MSEKKRITIYHGVMIELTPSIKIEDLAKKLGILESSENEDCEYSLRNEYESVRFYSDASDGIHFGADYIFTHVSTRTGPKIQEYYIETREPEHFVFISIMIDQIDLKNGRFVDCTGPDVHRIQGLEKFLDEKLGQNYTYSSNMIMEDR
jgi:hypothetical protein